MPKVAPGHRLYIYRLLSRELGVGKQTLMTRAEEVLVQDNIVPSDLGFVDMRALCDELGEFIKVTVFKKGYVYATVLANEDYDRMLERQERGGGEKSTKSFKHKGPKLIKPLKPKHIEPEPVPAPTPESPAADSNPIEPTPEIAPEPEPELDPVAEVVTEPAEPAPSSVENNLVATREASEAQSAERGADEVVLDAVDPEVVLAEPPEPEVLLPEPTIKLTITYAPEPLEDPDFKPEPVIAPVSETGVGRAHDDLPRDFYADVRCPDEQLSMLYQVLPMDADPMAVLEEDFRIARSTHTLEGTRSNVSFPLRYQKTDGSPVTVTLRRTARAAAGSKHWTLAEVVADAPEAVGLEGLSRKVEGAWRAFATDDQAAEATSPEDELASFAVLGGWEKLLSELSSLAAPEDWGSDLQLLKDSLTMTFHRIRCQGLLSMTDDGSSAAFDTGLLTADGEPIAAVLEPHDGDIIWELTCFSTNAQGRPATYPVPLGVDALVEALLANGGAQMRRTAQLLQRNPRVATCAYDAVADAVYALVPAGDKALPFAADDNGKPVARAVASIADARACARVVSSELPSWLK